LRGFWAEERAKCSGAKRLSVEPEAACPPGDSMFELRLRSSNDVPVFPGGRMAPMLQFVGTAGEARL
jgi:hypothetical protein